MHWDTYTIVSVVSGALLVIMGLAGAGRSKDRGWSLLGGAGMIAYGVYVAKQTSGTYFFQVQMFVIPMLAIIYLGASLLSRSSGPEAPSAARSSDRVRAPQTVPRLDRPASAAVAASATPPSSAPGMFCESCGSKGEAGARFCGDCGHRL